MIELLQEIEGVPGAYPAIPKSVTEVLGFRENLDDIWRRVEAYTHTRWTARNVAWVVSGEGEWVPPLGPVNSITAEEWDGAAYQADSPAPGPLGGHCLTGGTYRFTASIGGGTVPPEVNKAFSRFALYCLHDANHPELLSANSVTLSEGGEYNRSESYSRPNAWIAKAMQNSGAADLLRTWRRSK